MVTETKDQELELRERLEGALPEPEPEQPDAAEEAARLARADARAFLDLDGELSLEEIQAAFADDLWAFWLFFFQDYRVDENAQPTESPEFHVDFVGAIENLVLTGNGGEELARAYPREHAKSVFATMVTPMWATANEHKRFPVIFSDTFDMASDFLSDIRIEVEMNDRLQAIYPEWCEWAAEPNRRRLSFGNQTWIMCAGAGKSVRGARQQAYRPDLIVLDDIENDEEVESPGRRRKKRKWFNKVVKKLGRAAVFIIVGTILHADSFLNRAVASEDDVYPAVLSFATREDLWREWEEILRDHSLEDAKATARDFFVERKRQMLAGARVLWAGRFSYYELMLERAENLASFLSERQNQPLDPSASWFPEDRIVFLEGDDAPAVEEVAMSIMFWDPSRGTAQSDTSALARLDVLDDGRRYVSQGLAERLPPEEIMDILVGWHARRPFDVVGVERVGLSSYDEQLRAKAEGAGLTLPVEPVTPTGSKDLRIKSMRPLIVGGALVFTDSLTLEAKRQLKFYRQHAHDDFPDAVQQALTLAEEFTKDVKAACRGKDPDMDDDMGLNAETAFGRPRFFGATPEEFRPRWSERIGVTKGAWR